MIPSVRKTNFIIFLTCTAMILAAAYMEHVMKMIPCSLCITQRGFVILTGLIALIAALFGFTGIAAGAAGIAKILFVFFLIVAIATFLLGQSRKGL